MPHTDTSIAAFPTHWAAGDFRQPSYVTPNCSVAPFQARCPSQKDHLPDEGYPVPQAPPEDHPHSSSTCFCNCRRIGEATQPGPCEPDDLVTIGHSNPSGLRGKHLEAAQMGIGIWSYAETHLTTHTASSFSRALRALGRQRDRQIRTGNPVALRTNSRWAGTWSGVLQHSDFPSREIKAPWPTEIYNTGRLLMVRHVIGALHITVASCYGYPRNPTWPQGHKLTNELIKPLTQQLVIGQSGVRLILGDFNQQQAGTLAEQQIWMAHGWVSAQNFATHHLGHEWQPTSGTNSEVDQIWLSPEAAALCRQISIQDIFSGHATLAVQLQVPTSTCKYWTWPLPSEIPWHELQQNQEVNLDTMPQHTIQSTTDLQHWAAHFEEHVAAISQAQEAKLPPAWQGRAKRLAPIQQTAHTPIPKPSRQGEITLVNDAVGRSVRLWFKQARRLQSLLQALQAKKMTPAAQLYRAEVWTAIREAEGFAHTFPQWWLGRDPIHDTSPMALPTLVPDEHMAQEIFAEFNAHFRKFEAWHNSQRLQQLRAKHEKSHKQLYQDLRQPKKDSIDMLWTDETYPVLAVDQETNQLHLERELEPQPNAIWTLDDNCTDISNIDGDLCTATTAAQADETSILCQRVFTADIHQLHEALLAHWQPIWQAATDITDDRWERIGAFITRFLPQYDFPLQPITITQWRRAVRKLKPTAARGTDGIARLDLLHMSDQHTHWLLKLLDNIELGTQEWPAQWLTGIIHAIAKHDHAHTPGDYRPIHLFAIIYRLWASIRTKQTLQQMRALVPEAACGFLPGRETTQVWLAIQTHIEHAVNFDLQLCGLSTDLKKCFNHIERPQIFKIAAHLGISQRITRPWSAFLGSFERRFHVRNAVSRAEKSTRGVAEGDPLSILAMVQINWCHHLYMEVYVPKLSCRSFVDNLCLMTQNVDTLMRAMAATITCMDLWGLAIDQSKTYVWSVDSTNRQHLRAWDYAVQFDARELGGSLTLCKAIRNRNLKARGSDLEEKWQRLTRSLAPILKKLMSLYTVFWPGALHGAAAVIVADNYTHALRVRAAKALHFTKAGTNLKLKLTLFDKPLSDPGFFQLRLVMYTFQRMLRKWSDLLYFWKIFMMNYNGKITPGPICKLLLCMQQIGWSTLQPPFFRDHLGNIHDFYSIDSALLDELLEDAWCQHVASTARHKTMQDFKSMSRFLTRLDHAKLPPLSRARVSALQSGSFISQAEKAKFDLSKNAYCDICQCLDDRKHWLLCPRYCIQRLQAKLDVTGILKLPDCAIYHLLMPRLPIELKIKQFLQHVPSEVEYYATETSKAGLVDLFTDGACRRPFSGHSVAAWAIYNATSHSVLAAAPLVGYRQTTDRAELTAIVMALNWGNEQDMHLRIWSDAQAVVDFASQLLLLPDMALPDVNFDLWLKLQELIQHRPHLATEIRWVPSHLRAEALEDEFECWVKEGNDAADHAASIVLDNLGPLYEGLVKELQSAYAHHGGLLAQLRSFYLILADETLSEGTPDVASNELPQEGEPPEAPCESISDAIPLSWRSLLPVDPQTCPTAFIADVIQQLLTWDDGQAELRWRSDVELLFAFLQDSERRIPVKGSSGTWTYQPLHAFFERPTFAKIYRVFRNALDLVCSCFDPDLRCDSVFLPRFRIKVKGFYCSLPASVSDQAMGAIVEFTNARPIRHSRDLARPLR